jgi:hypothetical protein
MLPLRTKVYDGREKPVGRKQGGGSEGGKRGGEEQQAGNKRKRTKSDKDGEEEGLTVDDVVDVDVEVDVEDEGDEDELRGRILDPDFHVILMTHAEVGQSIS